MKGKLTITRISSNQADDGDRIRIRVEDETSGIEFIEVRLTPEALGLALTGLAYQECSYEFFGLENVGKRREVKTEIVTVSGNGWQLTDEEKRQALAPFEVDGWTGNERDLSNHHKMAKGDSKRFYVTFSRFVEASDET